MRDWLPEDDLAWLVIDAVAQVDLGAFRRSYRADGQGRAAFDPAMMVGLLLYAYCNGVRSSRQLERRCVRDVGFRVICGGLRPDHVTIARFRSRHAAALETVFTEVLRLCAEAGMVDLAVLAIDGTKVAADASWAANRTAEQIDAELAKAQPNQPGTDQPAGSGTAGSGTAGSGGGVLRAASAAMIADAAAVDAAEDARFGDARGDELPEPLRTRSGRVERLTRARDRLAAVRAAREQAQAKKLADWQHRRDTPGLRPGRKPSEHPPGGSAHSGSALRANVTDPDARIMKAKHTLLTGYNALAVVTRNQVIVGSHVCQDQTDRNLLHPTLDITRGQLAAAGVDLQAELGRHEPTVLCDAGFVTEAAFTQARTDKIRLLAPAPKARNGQPADLSNRPETARGQRRLRHPRGQRDYALRAQTVEPVFGQLKTRQTITRFSCRSLDATTAEWHLASAAHNLLKLHTHRHGS